MDTSRDKDEVVRILFVNLYTEMGGCETAVYNLLKNINRKKFEPFVLFNKRGPFVDKVEALGVRTIIVHYPVIMLRELVKPLNLADAIRSSRRLYGVLREHRIDIVHCSDVLALSLFAVPVLLLRINVVYNVIFYYEWTRMLAFNLLAVLAVRKIVTNSEGVRKHVGRRSVLLRKKTETIYPGVDTSVFRAMREGEKNVLREEFAIRKDVRLIGMVGRFDPSKGHKIFLRAAALMLKERKDVKFFIAGGLLFSDVIDTLEPYRREVIDTSRQLCLGDVLILLGHRDDMPEVTRSLDILVCPSENEGFGLVILEALASGVPVVASRTVGSLEVVGDSAGVFLAEPCDSASFAKSICDALEYIGQHKPNIIQELVRSASRFSWKESTLNFEKYYSKTREIVNA